MTTIGAGPTHWSIREKLDASVFLRQRYDEYWLWHGVVWAHIRMGPPEGREWSPVWHV